MYCFYFQCAKLNLLFVGEWYLQVDILQIRDHKITSDSVHLLINNMNISHCHT